MEDDNANEPPRRTTRGAEWVEAAARLLTAVALFITAVTQRVR